jgi:hypothetical protein
LGAGEPASYRKWAGQLGRLSGPHFALG